LGELNKLIILSEDAAKYAELIARLNLPNLEFTVADTPPGAEGDMGECNILLGDPRQIKSVLDAAQCLEWVQSTWAGVDALVDPQLRSDYVLTGVKDVFGQMMSEYVFAYILALERNIINVYANQQKKHWQDLHYQTLQERHLGVCGLGSIGRHIAQTGKHFGMEVWGYKRTFEAVSEIDRVCTDKDFGEFLAFPDFMVITLPSTPYTFQLFDDAAFKAMKKTAVLINVGRGSVVSENALMRALDARQIGGAVLDVFEKEPLTKASPLWTNPNVLITPHISALSFPEDIVNIFAENYRRFISDQPLLHVIDFNQGY